MKSKRLFLLLYSLMFSVLFHSVASAQYGKTSPTGSPKIVNVSSWDPKPKVRNGRSFSEHDVTALEANGSRGLIARVGKGPNLDVKCADFLASASRTRMMLGSYYFMLKGFSPSRQADTYINRLQQISRERGLQGRPILLVADMDTKATAAEMCEFIARIIQRTGIRPMIYLENSDAMRRTMRGASPQQKSLFRQCPYWMALYSSSNGFEAPDDLLHAHETWNTWSMWQYAGVLYEGGRDLPKVYHHARWNPPTFFGNIDRALEHSVFNGSDRQLQALWMRHSVRFK